MASSVNLSSLGIGALLANQRALSTTSHNIANVNTPGFSRQRANFETQAPQFTGGAFFGQGVALQSVQRLVDEVAENGLRTQHSEHAQVAQFLDLARRVDNLVTPSDTGLSGVLADFHAAMQDLTQDPASSVLREGLIGRAGRLSDRFNLIEGQIAQIDDDVDGRLAASVAEINRLTASIATVNEAIVQRTGQAGTPNDLLDRRDQLLRELSSEVSISTVQQDDGATNVFARGGQTLVLGSRQTVLSVGSNSFDAQRSEILNNAGVAITDSLTGGRVGATVEFRNRLLDPVVNGIGRLAVGLAESFNAQHRLGLTPAGALGGDFFSISAPQVAAHTSNTGGAVTAAVTDVGGLTTSDYRLDFAGADTYTLTRLSDGQTTSINTGGTTPFTAAEVDGVTLTITAGAAVGDSFLLRPTAAGAATIRVAVTSPAGVAAASPVRTSTPLANSGSGALTVDSVNSVANLPLTGAPVSGPLTLTFSSATNEYTLTPDPLTEGPLAFNPATESGGKTFSLLGGDLTITVSGVPADGDQLVIEHNTGGVGDNTNAVALAGLQTLNVIDNATASLQEALGGVVFQVGNATRDAEVSEQAFGALLAQAEARRESVSGVNLDEEAANLLRFQQAYQASARIISVADELFKTLLAATNT